MTKENAIQALVQLDQGAVCGQTRDLVSTFYAIPYAAAPVGSLRFAPPEAASPWQVPLDCTVPGAVAPQNPSRLRLVMGDFHARQDENCLTLTIWAPRVGERPKPVLVWLHGGAFMSGGGALDWYSGEVLSREGDVVVVGVNYRLGAFGFLHHPNVAGGNMGLLDQQAALQWVQKNIKRFGGDPTSVTLCGQSAGGLSIAHLLTMKGAKELFHRCIIQSGPLGLEPLSSDEASANAEALFDELGLDLNSPDFRQRLNTIPAVQIVSAQFATIVKRSKKLDLKPGDQNLPFRPVADGTILPKEGLFSFASAAERMDVLIGTTREEYGSFLAFDTVVQALESAPVPASDLKRLLTKRPGGTPADLLGDYLCEKLFLKPSLKWAEDAANAGRQVFVYAFDWQSPTPELGSCHCLELPFVFGTWEAFEDAPMLSSAPLDRAKKIGISMRAAWLQFVNKGDLSAPVLPSWPAFTVERPMLMRIGEVFEPVGIPRFLRSDAFHEAASVAPAL